ncbi:hypothetical protein BTHI11S_04724 [Bosea thiooxidans]
MGDVDVPQRRVAAALDQRRPVDDVELHLEAGRLHLLRHDQRHAVMEVILLRVQDADRRAVILGLGQELLGAGGIGLAVLVLAGFREEGRALREVLGRLGEELRLAEAGHQHLFEVERHLEGLPDLQIGHRPLLGVGREIGEAEGHGQHGARGARPGQLLEALDRQLVGELILTGDHAFEAGIGVRHRDEAQLVDLRLALAGIAGGRLAARGIAIVLDQHDELVGLALAELVGAGADEFGQRVGDRFLRHDRGEAGRQSEMRQQRRLDLAQHDLDRCRPLGRQADNALGEPLAARRHLEPALQRGDDVLGIEIAAIVELDALAQLDRVGLAVGRDGRQRGSQHRLRRPVGVEGEQRLVDMVHDRTDEVGSRRHRIERLRLADHGEVRARGPLRRSRKRAHDRRGGEAGRKPGEAAPGQGALVEAFHVHDVSPGKAMNPGRL